MAQQNHQSTETTPLVESTPKKQWSRGLYYGRWFSTFLERTVPGFGAHGSLAQSWDYFEQYILPRRSLSSNGKAVPGDVAHSELYPAWTTPQASLSHFGTGIAVYFDTLRAVFWIFLGAFILYLPSILYYASGQYDPDVPHAKWWDFFLNGSLMCVHTAWVPCVECDPTQLPGDRMAYSINSDDESKNVLFVLQNDCTPMRWQEGVNHLVVIVYLVIALIYLGFYQKKRELQYDEDVLTAQDYSVTVLNPPPDAVDANEWKEFFSQFGIVVYCTVSLDNETLVKSLVQRRSLLMQALFQTTTSSVYDDPTTPTNTVPEDVRTSHPALARKCDAAETKCRTLLDSGSYQATRIFITFETEQAQRKALAALTVSQLAIAANDTRRLASEQHVFRSKLVLHVVESMEPSAVRWRDLNETAWRRTWQKLAARSITLVLIGLSMGSVAYAFTISTSVAAILIAGYSSMASTVFAVVNMLESHEGETSYQASLFAKMVTFRFFNSVLAPTFIKPFTYTAGVSSTALIPAIYAVLLAEIVVTPLSYLADPVGQCDRHILAPLAKNQVAMNSYFRGSKENLGDKYTNMVKIIFLCFFYSVIFPAGFFLGALSIAALYYSDKFLLVRRWAPIPELGDDMTRFSRRVVIPFCLISLILVSEFYWSAFPYDNVCDTDTTVSSANGMESLVGNHSLTTFTTPSETVHVSVHEGDKLYRYCDQYYLAHLSGLLRVFEIETDDWMSIDQQWLTYLFGLVCVVVVAMLLVVLCKSEAIPLLHALTAGGFETREKDSGLLYSQQENIKAYVPHEPHPFLPFPLIACDLRNVDTAHIGWVDPLRGHQYYDMGKDVEYLLNGKDVDRPVLSVVQHWTP